ncbi:2-oxoglutarate and iron-dependent oxygenase domain-containing protein 3-like isoform X2 [Cylas formicarius]|uniref:2-oxoglutarate and iron-dependent oxygenase domain-containing protein 3-like isoform X2 n=1 Tax=Cylas formicarius TaxID=197179 RepID=UPI002958515C|nr:2-oxoglutarate and iron-dependent oxygenase domain-containing protein 3-like isoform X2 [Cylas formicarius]
MLDEPKIVEQPKFKKRFRKKPNKTEPKVRKHSEAVQTDENITNVSPKYGPMPRFSGQRLWSKAVVMLGITLYIWYFSKSNRESVLARQDKTYAGRGQHVECDLDYLDEIRHYPGCVPKKCGRYVSDQIVTAEEADVLLWLAKKGMSIGGSTGGATIMDLHSGALSYKDNFINFYTMVKQKFISPSELTVYQIVRTKIQNAIAECFGIDVDSLYLTHPTFFSRLTGKDPVTAHDEYWLIHVDKHTYESFHYTSLLYLNDYGIDFKGGRFIYLDQMIDAKQNVSVEPRKGRVSMFTSGAENPHYVERVIEGERFAITISFTCDESKKISDPVDR